MSSYNKKWIRQHTLSVANVLRRTQFIQEDPATSWRPSCFGNRWWLSDLRHSVLMIWLDHWSEHWVTPSVFRSHDSRKSYLFASSFCKKESSRLRWKKSQMFCKPLGGPDTYGHHFIWPRLKGLEGSLSFCRMSPSPAIQGQAALCSDLWPDLPWQIVCPTWHLNGLVQATDSDSPSSLLDTNFVLATHGTTPTQAPFLPLSFLYFKS